ncbi:MAG: hypothetical protein NZ519_12080, partial [Bacteroidia bacterium]|nr:hypothetical protein [Bacteroidia bacterium]
PRPPPHADLAHTSASEVWARARPKKIYQVEKLPKKMTKKIPQRVKRVNTNAWNKLTILID